MVKSHSTSSSSTTTSSSTTAAAASQKYRNQKQYKGVRMRSWGSWVSEIRAPNQKTRIWLGSYSTPEAAARAYDAALLCLKGSSASLNFPLSSPHQPPSCLLSPKSIQRIAAAAAADSTPPPQSPPSFSSTSTSTTADAATATFEEEMTSPPASAAESLADFGAFQSPKCFMDPIWNPFGFFVPSLQEAEEFDEIDDLSLWSFS